MILGAKELSWNLRVIGKAEQMGWTAFMQATRNQRQRDPSVILVRGRRVLAVWLRTSRARPTRSAPLDRFAGSAVEAYLWTPADWSELVDVLSLPPAAVSIA